MSDDRAPPPSYGDLFDSEYVPPVSVIYSDETGEEQSNEDEAVIEEEEGDEVREERIISDSTLSATEREPGEEDQASDSIHGNDDATVISDEQSQSASGTDEIQSSGEQSADEVEEEDIDEEEEIEEEAEIEEEDIEEHDEILEINNIEENSEILLEESSHGEVDSNNEGDIQEHSITTDDVVIGTSLNVNSDDQLNTENVIEPSAPLPEIAPPTYDDVVCHAEGDSNLEGLSADVIDPPMYHELVHQGTSAASHQDCDTQTRLDDVKERDSDSIISESPPDYHEAVTTLVLSGLSPQPSAPTVSDIERSHATFGFNNLDDHEHNSESLFPHANIGFDNLNDDEQNTDQVFPPFDATVDDHDAREDDPDINDDVPGESNEYEKAQKIHKNFGILLHFIMALVPFVCFWLIFLGGYLLADCEDKVTNYTCAVSGDEWVCERICFLFVIGCVGLFASLCMLWRVKVFSWFMIPLFAVLLIIFILFLEIGGKPDKYTDNTSQQILEEMKECRGDVLRDECWNNFKMDFCTNWFIAQYHICSPSSRSPETSLDTSTLPHHVTVSLSVISNCTDEFAYYVDNVYYHYIDRIWVPALALILLCMAIWALVLNLDKRREEFVSWRMYNARPCKYCPCGDDDVEETPPENIQISSYNNTVDTRDETNHYNHTSV